MGLVGTAASEAGGAAASSGGFGWMGWAGLSLSVLSMGMGSSANEAAAKAQAKYQAWRNAMAQISNAQTQNAITDNTVAQIQQSARQAMGIQRTGMEAQGASEVQAAAAGVTGRSVAATERNLERQTMHAEEGRRQTLQDMFANERIQRMNSAMQATLGQSYSYIPQPSSASSLLGFGAGALKNYGADIGKWFNNQNFSGFGSSMWDNLTPANTAHNFTTSSGEVVGLTGG